MGTQKLVDTIVWRHLVLFSTFHFLALFGLFSIISLKTTLSTFIWFFCTIQGVTSGVHRLWSHRSYKAKLPLRLFLAFSQTMSFQFSIWKWARDHRVHHKYSDTDADPHNSSRGFFFSHVGWLLVEPHPDFTKRAKEIDCSDLRLDPIVYYQNKFFVPLTLLLSYVFPAVVPWYFWSENFFVAFTTAGALRYILVLHLTWLINSAAHLWGNKPYDRSIKPVQNWVVSLLMHGEGWHNYHHTFPWDYKAEELGRYSLNLSTAFIDLMAKVGLAYDLKTASRDVVEKRMKRTGETLAES